MAVEMENCTMPMTDMEQTGCNMDMTGSKNSISAHNFCDMELSMNSCMIEKYYDSSYNFVVTQKYQSLKTFTLVTIIDRFGESKEISVKENFNTFLQETSPPIYLFVQSFLI